MPYEYEISIGERAWESVYIHDYTYVWNRTVKRRKLLGDVKEEELVDAEINEKDYPLAFSADGRRLFKIGVEFNHGKRNITRWIVGE